MPVNKCRGYLWIQSINRFRNKNILNLILNKTLQWNLQDKILVILMAIELHICEKSKMYLYHWGKDVNEQTCAIVQAICRYICTLHYVFHNLFSYENYELIYVEFRGIFQILFNKIGIIKKSTKDILIRECKIGFTP